MKVLNKRFSRRLSKLLIFMMVVSLFASAGTVTAFANVEAVSLASLTPGTEIPAGTEVYNGTENAVTLAFAPYETGEGIEAAAVTLEAGAAAALAASYSTQAYTTDVWYYQGQDVTPGQPIVYNFLPMLSVTYDMQGHGEQIAADYAVKGDAIGDLPVPSAEGFDFGGWYRDTDCTAQVLVADIISENMLLYAKWTETEPGPQMMQPDHICSWSYTADGSSITASCTEVDCTVTSPLTITLTAESQECTDQPYDGAVLDGITEWTAANLAELVVTYAGAGETLYETSAAPPTEVGTYTISATVAGTDSAVTVTAGFSITPAVVIGNSGYPYGKNMGATSITLVVDATNATTYQWQESSEENGEYADIDGATETAYTLTPVQGRWYRCKVNDEYTCAVKAIKASEQDGFLKAESGQWYLTNDTIAYSVWSTGKFDIVGKYSKDGTAYWMNTSYKPYWLIGSAEAANPVPTGNYGNENLAELRFSFSEADDRNIFGEAVLATGYHSAALGTDTMLGTHTITDYADNASLKAILENDTLAQVQMVGAKSLAEANEDDPAFVFTPITAADFFWIGAYGQAYNGEAYTYNLKLNEYPDNYISSFAGQQEVVTEIQRKDSAMAISWTNLPDNAVVSFQFSVGSVADTNAEIEVSDSGYTGIYDGQPHSAVITVPAGAEVLYKQADGGYTAEVPSFTDAGTYIVEYKVTMSGAPDSTGSTTVRIDRVPVTVTADNVSKAYGAEEPALTWKITSGTLVGEETLSGIEAVRGEGENSGTYVISLRQLTDANPNYEITFVNGSFTIEAAPETPYIPYVPSVPTITVPVSGSENTVDVSAQISGSAATVNPIKQEEIDHVAQGTGAPVNIEINLTCLDKKIDMVIIPVESVEKIATAVADENANVKGLTIRLSTATVEVDAKTLGSLIAQSEGKNIQLNVDDTGTSRLNEIQQASIIGLDIHAGIDAYFTCNGERISDFNGGSVTVRIPFAVPEGYNPAGFSVWHVADDGQTTQHVCEYEGNHLAFTVNHFSDYIVVYDEADADAAEKEADEAARIAYLKNFRLVARSRRTAAPSGKDSVMITWYDKYGADLDEFGFDGFEIYRSDDRYDGYGDEPFFVSRTGVYYNTLISKGNKYYYKVRGYIIVDGEKYYTDWSLKAWRTVK